MVAGWQRPKPRQTSPTTGVGGSNSGFTCGSLLNVDALSSNVYGMYECIHVQQRTLLPATLNSSRIFFLPVFLQANIIAHGMFVNIVGCGCGGCGCFLASLVSVYPSM